MATGPDRSAFVMTMQAVCAMLTVCLVAGGLTGCEDTQRATRPGVEVVTIGSNRFELDVAANDADRTKGLMHRESVASDGGMLFIFPDAQPRAFWMAYCLVDIDIIYLDSRGRVTATYTMKAQPVQQPDESTLAYESRIRRSGDYPSVFPAQFAIELRAGWLARLDLKIEDLVELDLERIRKLAH